MEGNARLGRLLTAPVEESILSPYDYFYLRRLLRSVWDSSRLLGPFSCPIAATPVSTIYPSSSPSPYLELLLHRATQGRAGPVHDEEAELPLARGASPAVKVSSRPGRAFLGRACCIRAFKPQTSTHLREAAEPSLFFPHRLSPLLPPPLPRIVTAAGFRYCPCCAAPAQELFNNLAAISVLLSRTTGLCIYFGHLRRQTGPLTPRKACILSWYQLQGLISRISSIYPRVRR